ncbi:DNA-directed RNA polymerase subunit omega [Sorangium sp. So ce1078]
MRRYFSPGAGRGGGGRRESCSAATVAPRSRDPGRGQRATCGIERRRGSAPGKPGKPSRRAACTLRLPGQGATLGPPMARVTVEDCLEREENRFALVVLAANRTRQLMKGSDALVKTKNKPAVTSLREIAAGKVHFHRSSHEVVSEWLQQMNAGGQR